jgi:hypothetical protein
MTSAAPLVRARFCQEWLEQVAREDEPYKGRFFAALDPDMRQQIESATRVAWLPAGFHVRLADTLHETFGEVRAYDYYRRAFAHSLRGPIFGPAMKTISKLLDVTPASLVRWAGRGWEASFQNAGTLVGEILGPGKGRLVYTGLPPEFTASTPWMMSSQGSCYGAFDLVGAEGVVRVDLSGRAEGGMIVNMEWTVKGGSLPPPASRRGDAPHEP